MKKTLRFFFLSIMMMLCGTAMAENKTVVFDAGVDVGTNTTASGEDQVTKDGVTIKTTSGGLAAAQFRFAKGSVNTFSSTVGNITKVVFTCTASGTTKYGPGCFTGEGYTYEGQTGTWTGNAASLQLTAESNQVRATKIVVTIGEGGDDDPEQPTIETEGKGTLESPYTPADAAKVATALGTTSTENYYIKGKVSTITYEFDADHGMATFYISADGTTEGQFLVYGAYYLENKAWQEGNAQIKVGDDVIIFGKLTNYKGTPETASKQNYIYSLNGNTKNEVQKEEPQPQDPTEAISVAKALEIINALADGKTTSEEYLVQGYVVEVTEISTQYGNATFTIADEKGGDATLTVFRVKGFGGESIADENIVKKDDQIVVKGKLQKYVKNDVVTPELATGGQIVSINGASASIAATKANAQQKGQLFNLSGQRVSVAKKGLYIRDGKKFIVK